MAPAVAASLKRADFIPRLLPNEVCPASRQSKAKNTAPRLLRLCAAPLLCLVLLAPAVQNGRDDRSTLPPERITPSFGPPPSLRIGKPRLAVTPGFRSGAIATA